MKYSIIIPTYNHCNDLLKPCLESIIKYTDLSTVEILIVANGCIDETKDYVESLGKPFKLIWFDQALGYTKATNEGIKQANGEYIVLLNNDTEILPSNKNRWLEILENPFINIPKVGVTGPLSLYDKDVNSNFILFWCAMIPKAIFNEIGILDEIFSPGYGEDIDFCMRCKEVGYEVICTDQTEFMNNTNVGTFPIFHKNNKTFGEITNYSNEIVIRNRNTLRNRYSKQVSQIFSNISIGVITPVYNNEKFILNCLDSVSNQTVKHVTHYLYHDCGTDNSLEIIKNYKSTKNIVLIHGDINRGQSYGRNVLIKKAIEDGCTHLAFIDSDDKWDDVHLEESLNELKDNDLIYSRPRYVFETGNPAFPFNIPVPHVFIGKQLKFNNFIWISSVVAKAECFHNNDFDSNLNSVEDWDMWIRLADQNCKFVDKKTTTVTYIVKENGSAGQGHTKMPSLTEKHKLISSLKLNVACGDDYEEDYINLDYYPNENSKIDAKCDVKKLPYDDNTIDEIKAFHIIEHFDFFEGQEALKEWYRVLKPGGKLYLETPNFLELCKAFVAADEVLRINFYNHFFAHPWFPGGAHKFLFTETQLKSQLSWAQFQNVVTLESTSKYSIGEDKRLFLTIEAYK